jgi:hypothetical protein
VVDDLNEIEFTVKKASKVIADITKGIMTDKWVAARPGATLAGVYDVGERHAAQKRAFARRGSTIPGS